MKKILLFLLLASTCLYFSCNKKRSGKPRVLVFSKTAGYVHASIPKGIAAIQKLGNENNFEVDTTANAEVFTDDSLKNYAAVIFLSTTGDVLNSVQETAFERYIQAGGGYVGIHAAADTEYDWGWYGRLVGGYFMDHPGIHDSFPNVQEGVLQIQDANNEATKHLPKQWKRTDEFYSYKKLNPEVKVLMTIDENSYKGGFDMGTHPMSWYHDYDGGRAFYTALGHTDASYTEDNYLKHILGGIKYAMGDNKSLDYAKATSQYAPDEDRFTKTQLTVGEFYEPTEMTILPNFDVLVIQRRGEIMLYKNETKKVKQVGFFDVYYKTLHTPGVNAEEGMLGLAKDPNFARNNFVYIYYSPSDTSVNRLSRFVFKNDTLDKATEKPILEVKSQREICCHTGGSIAFGPDGLLYVSAGDNSTPFDEPGQKYVNHGYGPLNDLPGHEQYDARRSSGNTNDLRGKILRIRVKDDGTYEIPDGNLFAKGTDKTRPEIYVMGNRNPYRITVDQKNSNLYWGEVGPDARNDSFGVRGTKGYDELNQARKAGYFGWPFFVGNNFAYNRYDYATGQSGAAYDPAKPVNESRNNTGLKELPAVAPPFIWYPYDASPDFPQVGTGGRNAMAGPVYYTDLFPKETRMPDYYNGKLFFYDWIRGWIKLVTTKANGDFDKMEPFMAGTKFNSPIDMEVGPDGKMYILEYGNGWFTKNPDAGLVRIDYNGGNRPPAIKAVTTDKTSGVLPLAINFKVDAKDMEKDDISYKWDLGNGTTKETKEPNLSYTYTTAGDFAITVEAKDGQGAASTSSPVRIYAGNEAPQVTINLTGGNKSFYIPGKPVQYSVEVKDNDTSKLDMSNLYVSVDYVEGFDRAGSTMGHQQGSASISGKNLMLSLDCKSCHKEAEKSIGPAYLLVSEKYQKDRGAMNYLTEKIIKGGSGVWGEVAMPAHTAVPVSDIKQIVTWIMTLANKTPMAKSLPAKGSIVPPADKKPGTAMVLSASYTDKGGNNIKPLTGSTGTSLRNNSMSFTGKEKLKEFTVYKMNGANLLVLPQKEGWFAVDSIDLSGIQSINIMGGWQEGPKAPLAFEAHLDGPTGKLLGQGSMPAVAKEQKGGMIKLPIEAVTDGKFHALYIVYKFNPANSTLQGGVSGIQFNGK